MVQQVSGWLNFVSKVAHSLTGPQMLAFLPAWCLGAFWLGGEAYLVTSALAFPMFFAVFGRFAPADRMMVRDTGTAPNMHAVAQDFLSTARRTGQITACFQITVPELAVITAQHGAEYAVDARRLVAARLKSGLRAQDRIFDDGHIGFTILLSPGFRLRHEALLDLANRLRSALDPPITSHGTTHPVTARIGIASSLQFGREAATSVWLDAATDAAEVASVSGPGTLQIWSPGLARDHKARHAMSDEIAGALDNGRIQAFFQPQIDLRSGAATGMAVSARWDHPTGGLLPSGVILQSAKDACQMPRLGRSIFLQAATNLLRWDDAGYDVKTLSLPLSQCELRDPDLPARISGDVARCGVSAQRIIFDIAAPLLTSRAENTVTRNLRALTEIGCRFDMRGLGTGGSGLRGCDLMALQQMPISRLKLDRDFSRACDVSDDHKRAVQAILALCEHLSLGAVATGVETRRECDTLQKLGCSTAQGDGIAPAANAAETTRWLSENSAAQIRRNNAVIHHLR